MNDLWTEVMKMLSSLVAAVAFYAIVAVARAVMHKLRAEAAEIHDQRLRYLAETLIQAAEVRLCDLSGPERMNYVLARLSDLGLEVDEDLVEGIFQQLKSADLLPAVKDCAEGEPNNETD